MSLRTALLSGAIVTNLAVGLFSAIGPGMEHVADAKLDAVIAELSAPKRPIVATTTRDAERGSDELEVPPTTTADPGRRRTVGSTVATTVPEAPLVEHLSPPAPAAPDPAAIEARPASPAAAPTGALTAAIDDEFDGKGIARASAEQQAELVEAVCSAFDEGYSRAEIVERALQEDGTSASGIERFLDVATETACPEHVGK